LVALSAVRLERSHRPVALAALFAFAAADSERNDYTVADLELLVLRANLDDFAHEFMAQYIAFLHKRNVTVHQMQVRAADRAGGHLDDGVPPVFDLGIRNVVAADVALARQHSAFIVFLLGTCVRVGA
jgi:hypothetical protein